MYRIFALFIIVQLMILAQSEASNKYDSYSLFEKKEVSVLKRDIEKIISEKRTTVGVAVTTDECNILTLNGDVHYPLMSMFKFHIALTVLDMLDKNKTPLDSIIFIEKSKLHHNTYSPIVKLYPNQDVSLSIGELIRYSVSHSDNNACDFLIEYVGGISKVEEYIMGLGVSDFQLRFTEHAMHDDIMRQYDNWSTPASANRLLQIFLNKPLFARHYKDFLIQAMTDTTTGKNKLKALLPPETVVGHKTGSSDRTEQGIQIVENDIAFIYLPDGKRYYISVFVKDSKEDDEENVKIIARISKAVYDFLLDN